ncbi:methylaspartate mutase sigma subunit [Allocatelliglobosispora scoriae]|uniref:Methylaspartate mutase sigma subunit n=1 Tax=Allocatelliglobosispora scoriae TaxID=643052 RepID=A0A841BK35_9ACTN|nr:cobalamin-dependent protein [Allocatelliglobosispora scoriae]MBB5867180.1 methylaspartate mutase sigma subunit [Allocatelliglobosispora scoriae]
MPSPEERNGRLVILGVAASDSHAVANHLIAQALRTRGFTVVNLGVCTPVAEFADACERHPTAEAVIIGSLNGHVHEDLADLPAAKESGRIGVPVLVGGNLSVGAAKDPAAARHLRALGVDHVLDSVHELFELLDELHTTRPARFLLPPVGAGHGR